MFAILFTLVAVINTALACDYPVTHVHSGGAIYVVSQQTGGGHMSLPLSEQVTVRGGVAGYSRYHAPGTGLAVRGGRLVSLSQGGHGSHPNNPGYYQAVARASRWTKAQEQVVVVQEQPQVAPIQPVYDTNALTMIAVDAWRGVEPRPRRKLDPTVCWADAPPVGWESLPPVRRTQIKNDSGQFLSLSVQTRNSEEDRTVREDQMIDVVGGLDAAGYHLPQVIGRGLTGLAPGQTCYGVLPEHDGRAPLWSITAKRWDSEQQLGMWYLDDAGSAFEYTDRRGQPVALTDSRKEDDKGIRDRGQPTSHLVWDQNDFR